MVYKTFCNSFVLLLFKFYRMLAFPADVLDFPQIQSIYEYYVLNSTATFEEIPPSIDEMAVRFQTITAKGGVWLVAKEPGKGIIYGYAYYGPYRERSGYRYTVELRLMFSRMGTEIIDYHIMMNQMC